MAKRRKDGGRYVNVREKNTSKGKKGTIMGDWKPKKKTTNRKSLVTKTTEKIKKILKKK